jgi:plastocyanin
MKRHWLMPALSAASAFLTLACGSDSGGTSNNPPPAGDVLVQNDRFSPTTLSVTAGTAVTWAWDSDGQTHTVTSDDGSSFNSDQKSSGTFQHTFATAGTFAYHCQIHPTIMKGTITVTSAAGDGGSAGGGGGTGGGGGGSGGGGGGYGYMRTTPLIAN